MLEGYLRDVSATIFNKSHKSSWTEIEMPKLIQGTTKFWFDAYSMLSFPHSIFGFFVASPWDHCGEQKHHSGRHQAIMTKIMDSTLMARMQAN